MTYLSQRRAVSPSAESQRSVITSKGISPWIAGSVVALVAFGLAGCGSSDKTPATKSASGSVTSTAGDSAKAFTDGTFAFAVTGSKCGVKTVGPADLSQKATAQFCLVDVSVKNVGKQSTVLDGGAQKAIDTEGKPYPVAQLASAYLNDKDPNLLDAVKPGEQVDGVLPFQVPGSAKLAAIELHGAASTPGVRVPLP